MTADPDIAPTQLRAQTSLPLLGAAVFLLLYLAVSPVADAIAPLPLPDAPIEDVYAYFTDHGAASLVTGVLQLASVAGFALFLNTSSARVVDTNQRRPGLVFGWIAVAAMAVSCLVALFLPLTAAGQTPETVEIWRQVSFYAGGVVHVVALGGVALVIAASRGWTKPVRVMAWIAGIPALLSVLSIFFYYASILLPAGRLLTMLAFIVAGVSLARGRSLTTKPRTLR